MVVVLEVFAHIATPAVAAGVGFQKEAWAANMAVL
jgi:hypothetical protein